MERVEGIEPTFIAWNAIVLPLDDTRVARNAMMNGRMDGLPPRN
jgi:hypothetical protein